MCDISEKKLISLGFIYEFFFIILGFIFLYRYYPKNIFVPIQSMEYKIFFGLYWLFLFAFFAFIIKNARFLKNIKLILILFLLLSITLFFFWPFGSSDIFNYIFRARVLTVYHQNPYLVPPGSFSGDILDGFVIWEFAKSLPMIYGPLWFYITLIPNFLFGNNFLFFYFSLKFVVIMFYFGSIILAYKILENTHPDNKYVKILLFALNPFLLFEIAQNAHNDIVAVFFLFLSLFLCIKKRYTLVFPAFFLSVLIKYHTILFFPFFIIYLYKILERKNLKILFFSIFSAIILVIVLFSPFWDGIKVFSGVLKSQTNYYSIHSFLPFILEGIFHLPHPLPLILSLSVFFLFYIYFSWRLIIDTTFDQFVKSSMWSIVTFYSLISLWLVPWYFILPISLGILLAGPKDEKKYGILILFLTLMSLYGYIMKNIIFVFIFFPIFFIYYLFTLKNKRGNELRANI